jgi:hypothetical protein
MRFRNSPLLWPPRRAALQSHVPDKVPRFLGDDGQNRKSEVMRSRIGTGKRTYIDWSTQLPRGRRFGRNPVGHRADKSREDWISDIPWESWHIPLRD